MFSLNEGISSLNSPKCIEKLLSSVLCHVLLFCSLSDPVTAELFKCMTLLFVTCLIVVLSYSLLLALGMLSLPNFINIDTAYV